MVVVERKLVPGTMAEATDTSRREQTRQHHLVLTRALGIRLGQDCFPSLICMPEFLLFAGNFLVRKFLS
jgi:hypothetical protein